MIPVLCRVGSCLDCQVRRVNFVMGKPFTLTASYDSAATLPAGCASRIGTFKVSCSVLLASMLSKIEKSI